MSGENQSKATVVFVGLHGWNNFLSMITGWKRNLDYAMRFGFRKSFGRVG